MNSVTFTAIKTQMVRLARDAASGNDRKIKTSTFFYRVAAFAHEHGDHARADLLRKLLRELLSQNEPRIGTLNYPGTVQDLIRKDFGRIRQYLSEGRDEYYDLERHSARCDFRIACFSRVPIGVEHLEVGGVPRSLCCRGGVRQCVEFLRMLRATGGVQPLYTIHLAHGIDPATFLLIYNRKAQRLLLRNIAECLIMNPQYRGLYAASWWYDPALTAVSPHLTYLREGCLGEGAFFFRCWSSHGGLANSSTRKKLHAQGEYIPTTFAIVWPRDQFINWALDNTDPLSK